MTPPPPLLGWFVNHSYFLNFSYWEWYRYHNQKPEEIYWQKLKDFYNEKGEAWQVHQEELRAFIEYANKNKVVLLPILFPNLMSISTSKPIISQVFYFFQHLGIKSIDLSSTFSRCSPMDLIVNNMDAHPNELVNSQVAEILYDEVMNILSGTTPQEGEK